MSKNISEMFDMTFKKTEMPTVNKILDISRQNQIGDLSPYFDSMFKKVEGAFLAYSVKDIGNTLDELLDKFYIYAKQTEINDFVLGVSGGADSAVTLSFLNEVKKTHRNMKIHAFTLPILQNPKETERAKEVCDLCDTILVEKDLSNLYMNTYNEMEDDFVSLNKEEQKIRLGNIKARMRMMYLYDKARYNNGVVVSTDNYSEYMAGFWTLNGDVGDVSPLQYLFKSVEITSMGEKLGLPEHIWKATPTDGLGISNSDEDQLKMSYLEFDLLLMRFISSYSAVYYFKPHIEHMSPEFNKEVMDCFFSESYGIKKSETDVVKMNNFLERVKKSWFKRHGAIKFDSSYIPKQMFDLCFEELSISKKLFNIINDERIQNGPS